jgi:hypothetical protein
VLQALNDVYCLDIDRLTWSQVNCSGTPPAAREGHCATFLGRFMLVSGEAPETPLPPAGSLLQGPAAAAAPVLLCGSAASITARVPAACLYQHPAPCCCCCCCCCWWWMHVAAATTLYAGRCKPPLCSSSGIAASSCSLLPALPRWLGQHAARGHLGAQPGHGQRLGAAGRRQAACW